ncbi:MULTISPECIES: hypothetical protein [Xanthomonas]|nr:MULTISPECIES: hypothetical protein [Xanthomonas]ATS39295.2 hypothetical protein XcfCFBP6988P_15135 [Xanthomonas citri pv. phaseoli var. fuscans]ATS41898.2 hypothetical protein XcfCFBP6989P_05355 [Xanthomonas citri pv. phaseoli var. fuscans]ATS47298.2 hypothetical protein XcfCFBP6990P_12005 [Xanthomonas citri pv. phaseoli var. fuscans]ATS86323.2 hypothetical protein XcfCFBP6991P_22225 [Xanthomonas citri pv. phaseoli var. fuscans]UZA98043.1 hypothetical protein OM946_12585 [Xanthomonas citri 
MNEQSGNSEQLPPDAGSGGDARAQFEEWAHDNAFATNRDDNGVYLSEDTYGAWLAWQHLAARQPVDLSKFRDAVMHAYGLATDTRFERQLGKLLDLIDTPRQQKVK